MTVPRQPGASSAPTFELFRKYAKFTPEIGDFGMSQAEFQRFLADAGLGGLGGMLSGDTGLLFRKHAVRNYLNYDGICNATQTLHRRIAIKHPMDCRAISTVEGRTSARIPPVTSVSSLHTGSHSSANRALLPGQMPSTTPLEPRKSRAETLQPLTAPPRKKQVEDMTQEQTPEVVKSMNSRETLKQIRQQYFPDEETEWASLQQRHNEYSAVRLMLEEPSLIREVIPPPKKLPSARVQTAAASVQAAISQGDFFLAKKAIVDVERTWLNELIHDKADTGESPKKTVSKKRMMGTASDALRLIPKEGWCYIKLQSVSVAISRGDLKLAEKEMESAWEYITALEHNDHIYQLLGLFMDALVKHFTHSHQEAAELFEECVENVSVMHGMDWRVNAAAASNNAGVCYQNLGMRGKALSSYEGTQTMLHGLGLSNTDSRQLLVKKNISRLLRSAAMSKGMTPHMPLETDPDAARRKEQGKLLAFLKKAVPTRLMSVGVPEKKKKKKKPKKKKKGEEEKPEKKKKAGPPKKKLGVLLLPPRYGLQGIGALAPKKKKGKGKKKK